MVLRRQFVLDPEGIRTEGDTGALCRAAQDVVRAEVPPNVLDLPRMGRMTALQKPGGGVRGIVCGDVVRRLVAQTIAQQISPAVQDDTSPFEYALTTKAGRECVAHAILHRFGLSGDRADH